MSVCNIILVLLQSKLDGWDIFLQVFTASDYDDFIYAIRVVFRGYLRQYISYIINPTHILPLHNPSFFSWKILIHRRIAGFTTRTLTSFPSTSSETTSLHRPSIHCFASPHTTPCLSSDLMIIDSSHPPPEPRNLPFSLLFDG